jgi:iron complex transport system substrate-binding protein
MVRLRRWSVSSLLLLSLACGRSEPPVESVLSDAWGRAVPLRPVAQRIVSLAPATTEIVFALGAGASLVGRTTWCDWPAAAAAVTDVGNGLEPSVEVLAALRPDLVLAYPSESNRSAVARLEGLGLRTAVVRQDAIADWREAVLFIAALLERTAAGESLLADFDARLAAARVAPRAGAPSVLVAVGANPPIAIGAGSFVSELVELAGGRNIFGDIAAPSAVVSLEAIVARDPDVIVVLGPDEAAREVGRRGGWRAVRAVSEGRVIGVDGSAFNRPSPRLPEALTALAARLAATEAR